MNISGNISSTFNTLTQTNQNKIDSNVSVRTGMGEEPKVLSVGMGQEPRTLSLGMGQEPRASLTTNEDLSMISRKINIYV